MRTAHKRYSPVVLSISRAPLVVALAAESLASRAHSDCWRPGQGGVLATGMSVAPNPLAIGITLNLLLASFCRAKLEIYRTFWTTPMLVPNGTRQITPGLNGGGSCGGTCGGGSCGGCSCGGDIGRYGNGGGNGGGRGGAAAGGGGGGDETRVIGAAKSVRKTKTGEPLTVHSTASASRTLVQRLPSLSHLSLDEEQCLLRNS